MAGFLDFLFGSKDKTVSPFDKNQNQLLQMLMQMAQQGPQSSQTYQGANNYLQNLYGNDQSSFNQFAAPYQEYFNQQTLPGIAERFAGMGSGNQNSSGFRNELANAGKDFNLGLAGLREQSRQSNLGNALNFAQAPFSTANALGQTALARPNQAIQQGSPGFLAPLLGAITKGFATGGADTLASFLSNALKPKTSSGLTKGTSSSSFFPGQSFNSDRY